MKQSFLNLFGILLLIVYSIEKEFDPDTKYFIYNKVTSKCVKRELTSNGYTEYYITKYGECTDDEDSLWYIKGSNIISVATGYCLAVVNYNQLSTKDCDKPVKEALFVQDFVFQGDTICTTLDNCLKDRRGTIGDKKNQDKYYEWTISTSLPE